MKKLFALFAVMLLVIVVAGCVGGSPEKDTTPKQPGVAPDTTPDTTPSTPSVAPDTTLPSDEELPAVEEDLPETSLEDDAEDVDFGGVI